MSASSSSTPPELSDEIIRHFNQSLSICYPNLDETCEFVDMDGQAVEKYGDDYLCSNVLSICTKLRSKDPELFSETGAEDIAKFIVKNLPKNSVMIPQVSIRNNCFLTFKISWEWMASRINKMLDDGIKTWAPNLDVRTAVVVSPIAAIGSNAHADLVRATCIKGSLIRMFGYADVGVRDRLPSRTLGARLFTKAQTEVRNHFFIEKGVLKQKSGTMHGPLFVDSKPVEWGSGNTFDLAMDGPLCDLADLWLGICQQKLDFMVYVAPVRRGAYIERCLAAARGVKWLNDDRACHCGYRTSSNEREKLYYLQEGFWNYSKADSLVKLGKAAGYKSAEQVFNFALTYSYLKNHRLCEFPLSIDELFDEKGHTFINLLHTKILVLSIIKNPPRGTFKVTKTLVAKERELGLHLIRFTEEYKEACITLLPHILCNYLWDLSKKFTSCYGEARPDETRLLLCRATSVVMEKCLDLLNINTNCSDMDIQTEIASLLRYETVNPFIPWHVPDARLENMNPRIELISMFVSISADFHKEDGYLSGSLALSDFYGLQDGWSKSDKKNSGHVHYFNRDWFNPLAIKNGSYIWFGNPSSRYAVSLASTIEIHTNLLVTYKKKGARKDACFELSCGKKELDKSYFWQNKEKRTECSDMAFKSTNGFIQIHYILLKDALDSTMELWFESPDSKALNVHGVISAYYGKNVLGEVKDTQKGFYEALIFKSDGMMVFPGKIIDLRKSLLSVPAYGDLILKAFIKDKSGETIFKDEVTYSMVTNNGFRKWVMPLSIKGKGKGKGKDKGKVLGSFNLALEWSKGQGILNYA